MPRVEFDKLSTVYDAIKGLDKVLESKNDDKIEEVINCIKEIDRSEFDPEIQNRIITDFKEALLKIYNDTLESLNLDIDIKTNLEYKPKDKYKESKIENTSMNEDVRNRGNVVVDK